MHEEIRHDFFSETEEDKKINEQWIKMQEESLVQFLVDPKIRVDVCSYIKEISDPQITREEFDKLAAEFTEKTLVNPDEYRLAYLRETSKNPDMYIKGEIAVLEQKLREKNKDGIS
jgi:hypothetical protein